MIPGSEVVTITKASVSITQGVKNALTAPTGRWPNAHEGLMELYIILEDWCRAAKASNDAVADAIEHRNSPDLLLIDFQISDNMQINMATSTGIVFGFRGGYIDTALEDISSIMSPETPWPVRWRGSKRRAAGWRTLKNLMKIYCSDLLGAFEWATEARALWVYENRKTFGARLKDPAVTASALSEDLSKMEATLGELEAVRDDLHALITERFPLGDSDG